MYSVLFNNNIMIILLFQNPDIKLSIINDIFFIFRFPIPFEYAFVCSAGYYRPGFSDSNETAMTFTYNSNSQMPSSCIRKCR